MNFLKRSPASLSDKELEEVRLRREWEAEAERERERRAEAKRAAEAEKAAAAVARARQKRVAELRREHGRAAEEARLVHVRLGAAVVEAGKVLAERGAALARARKAEEELAGMGEPRPALPLPDFTREAELAAQRLAPVLHGMRVNPLRGVIAASASAPHWADPLDR